MRDTHHGQDCCFCRIYLKWKKYNTEDPVIIFSGSFIDFQFNSKDHLWIFPGILELYTGIISSANSIQFKFPEISSQVAPTTPRWRSTHHSPFPLALFSVLVVEGWMSFTSTTKYLTRSMLDIQYLELVDFHGKCNEHYTLYIQYMHALSCGISEMSRVFLHIFCDLVEHDNNMEPIAGEDDN